jgi:protein TonB
VVLRITVDEDGWITNVWVQRAPEGDDLASTIAIDSMYRARTLPRPLNLANGADGTLSYSETFLFNADNQFQIRTLAPVQTAD